MLKIFRFWFPVAVYSGIIFYVSSLACLNAPAGVSHLDKIFHILEYIPFGFLLARALFNINNSLPKNVILGMVVFFSFMYGLSDEYHQFFVEGRDSTIFDALADLIGGMIGGGIYFFMIRRA